MKLYCECGKLVADIKEGSHIRKEAQMICKECIDKYFMKEDEFEPVSNSKDTESDFGDIFRGIFGVNKRPF